MKAISLAQEVPDYSKSGDMAMPSEPSRDEDLPKKKVYPSMYISDAPEALFSLPDEGTATIKYRVREKGIRERDGEKTVNCDIEILSITPNKGNSKAMENSTRDSDDALDDYFKEVDGDEKA